MQRKNSENHRGLYSIPLRFVFLKKLNREVPEQKRKEKKEADFKTQMTQTKGLYCIPFANFVVLHLNFSCSDFPCLYFPSINAFRSTMRTSTLLPSSFEEESFCVAP
jgi:hypothetical protein